MTGHCAGVITLNVSEADDTERVRRRVALHEPYRTLLGHLRHESGHFYWDRLILGRGRVEAFRAMFGDEHLHMVDLLETASSYNTCLMVPGADADDPEEVTNPFERGAGDFDPLVDQWIPLTLLLNSLNRSLGQDDAYPFALAKPALDKLRFVHDVIQSAQSDEAQPMEAPSCQTSAA